MCENIIPTPILVHPAIQGENVPEPIYLGPNHIPWCKIYPRETNKIYVTHVGLGQAKHKFSITNLMFKRENNGILTKTFKYVSKYKEI